MTKQEIVEELVRLYRLQDEGKNVSKLIRELEERLCELMGCENNGQEE